MMAQENPMYAYCPQCGDLTMELFIRDKLMICVECKLSLKITTEPKYSIINALCKREIES